MAGAWAGRLGLHASMAGLLLSAVAARVAAAGAPGEAMRLAVPGLVLLSLGSAALSAWMRGLSRLTGSQFLASGAVGAAMLSLGSALLLASMMPACGDVSGLLTSFAVFLVLAGGVGVSAGFWGLSGVCGSALLRAASVSVPLSFAASLYTLLALPALAAAYIQAASALGRCLAKMEWPPVPGGAD